MEKHHSRLAMPRDYCLLPAPRTPHKGLALQYQACVEPQTRPVPRTETSLRGNLTPTWKHQPRRVLTITKGSLIPTWKHRPWRDCTVTTQWNKLLALRVVQVYHMMDNCHWLIFWGWGSWPCSCEVYSESIISLQLLNILGSQLIFAY
jgi:hypothetical protein